VELLAEGEEEAVSRYLEDVALAMACHIDAAEVLDEPAAGGLRGFGVAFDEG
jgi:hypothetical protein